MSRPNPTGCPHCGAPMPPDADRCPRCRVSRKEGRNFWRVFWTCIIITLVISLISGLGIYYYATHINPNHG